jgi:hypothetical protein
LPKPLSPIINSPIRFRKFSGVHLAVIGRHLLADGVTIGVRFAVEMLVAADLAQQDHGRHPEVRPIRRDFAPPPFTAVISVLK